MIPIRNNDPINESIKASRLNQSETKWMQPVEIGVIGAGVSGCSLIARLRQCGYKNKIAVVEAGRGPGGRMATRQKRGDPVWHIDHGAPGFTLSENPTGELKELLKSLRETGALTKEQGKVLWLNKEGQLKKPEDLGKTQQEWWKGDPCMANICKSLIQEDTQNLREIYGCRIRYIEKQEGEWILKDESNETITKCQKLILSGNLLAHPRSLAMLDWRDVPLRQAVPVGEDTNLDHALEILAQSRSDIRWNLMVDLGQCPCMERPFPRQIFLTNAAKKQWKIERLVLQEQTDGRVGVVVHGMDSGDLINPESQPMLMAEQEQRLIKLLPNLLKDLPGWEKPQAELQSQGMMRWGASQPLDHPLPSRLQWCNKSNVGFCGDWIDAKGFGMAEAAFRSAIYLANQILEAQ